MTRVVSGEEDEDAEMEREAQAKMERVTDGQGSIARVVLDWRVGCRGPWLPTASGDCGRRVGCLLEKVWTRRVTLPELGVVDITWCWSVFSLYHLCTSQMTTIV